MEQRSALPSLNGRPPEVGVVLKAEVPVTRPSSSVATGDAERWGFYQKCWRNNRFKTPSN